MRPTRNLYGALILLTWLSVVTFAAYRRFTTPVEPDLLAVGSVLAGLLLHIKPLGGVLSHATTFTHELSHCVAAVAVGASPKKIVYHPDSSGLAVLEFPENVGRVRTALVLLAGYAGPALAAWLLVSGASLSRGGETLLLVTMLAAGALVVLVRNTWGFVVTLSIGLLSGVGFYLLTDRYTTFLVYAAAGYLAGGGIKDTYGQSRLRDPGNCDAVTIARLFGSKLWKPVAQFQLTTSILLAAALLLFLLIA